MPPRTINKSEFVRSLGDIPAKDVVEKAAAQGIRLSTAHVYTIRSAANRKAAKSTGHVARRGPGRPRKSSASGGTLHATIEKLARKFTDALLAELRQASIDSLRDV